MLFFTLGLRWGLRGFIGHGNFIQISPISAQEGDAFLNVRATNILCTITVVRGLDVAAHGGSNAGDSERI